MRSRRGCGTRAQRDAPALCERRRGCPESPEGRKQRRGWGWRVPGCGSRSGEAAGLGGQRRSDRRRSRRPLFPLVPGSADTVLLALLPELGVRARFSAVQ